MSRHLLHLSRQMLEDLKTSGYCSCHLCHRPFVTGERVIEQKTNHKIRYYHDGCPIDALKEWSK